MVVHIIVSIMYGQANIKFEKCLFSNSKFIETILIFFHDKIIFRNNGRFKSYSGTHVSALFNSYEQDNLA